jgi:transcription termination/antitermination protein NusG
MSRSQVDSPFPWFALQVKSRHEKAVTLSLRSKGYVEFLPLYHRCSSTGLRNVELPLFPSYVFCRFDPYQRLPILVTPGVFSIIGTQKGPLPIEDSEISAIQATVESGLHVEPCPYMNVGDYVCIETGPLCGKSGIVQRVKSKDRLIVSITLLQRSISIEIDSNWLTRPGPPEKAISGPCAGNLNTANKDDFPFIGAPCGRAHPGSELLRSSNNKGLE